MAECEKPVSLDRLATYKTASDRRYCAKSDVATDEEFDEMMNEVFGDDAGAGFGSSQGDGPDLDDPVDDDV